MPAVETMNTPPEATESAPHSHGVTELASDVACVPMSIVNVFFIGTPGAGDREWTLVDAGLFLSASRILSAAAERFGPDSRPAGIVLTHGHFDHVGVVRELAEVWDCPVYAHPLEMPYLTGQSSYPAPDPTVGGGMMTLLSPLYPRGPIDLKERIFQLPVDGTIPPLPGWRYIHTPGHTPGHIALHRELDGVLIAGDAFVTTKQESLFGALLQPLALQGPPAYFTPDWDRARESVLTLASLRPRIAGTGHGKMMEGAQLRDALDDLAMRFDEVSRPKHGRYSGSSDGAVQGQSFLLSPMKVGLLVALGAGLLLGMLLLKGTKQRK